MRLKRLIYWSIPCFILIQIFLYSTQPHDVKYQERKTKFFQKQFVSNVSKLESYLNNQDNLQWISDWIQDKGQVTDLKDQLEIFNESFPFTLLHIDGENPDFWTSRSLVIPEKYKDYSKWTVSTDSFLVKKYDLLIQKDTIALYAIWNSGVKFVRDHKKVDTNTKLIPLKIDDEVVASYIYSSDTSGAFISAPVQLLFYLGGWMLLFSSLIIWKNRFLSKKILVGSIFPGIVLIAKVFEWLLGTSKYIDESLMTAHIFANPFFSSSSFNYVLCLITWLSLMDILVELSRHLNINPKIAWVAPLKNYLIVFMGLLLLILVTQGLIQKSGIYLDFNNLLRISKFQFISILFLALFYCWFFLKSYKLLSIYNRTFEPKYKYIGASLSFILIFVASIILDANLPLLITFLLFSLFVLLFDMFLEIRSPTIGWLVIWVIFFSGFITLSIFKYKYDKEMVIQEHIAKEISNRKDSILFSEMSDYVLSLKNDANIYPRISNALLGKDYNGLEMILNKEVLRYPYIVKYYSFDFEVITSDGNMFSSSESTVTSQGKLNPKLTLSKDYYWGFSNLAYHGYLFKIFWQDTKEIPSPAFYFNINKRDIRLLLNEDNYYLPFLGIKSDLPLDYAVYEGRKLLENQGRIYPSDYEFSDVEKGKTQILSTEKRSELITHLNDHFTIIIGKQLFGLIKPISMFSFFFILFIIFICLIAILNSFKRFLPTKLNLHFQKNINLRLKIEYSILLVIIASFVFIAWFTIGYFKNLSLRIEETSIREKSNQIMSDIQNLRLMNLDSIDKFNFNVFTESMGIDANIYNGSGKQIFNSRYNKFNAGQNYFLDPIDYLTFNRQNILIQNHLNNRGNSYSRSVSSIKNIDDNTMGYLELPLDWTKTGTLLISSDFLGTLLNVYVFLLLIAGAITIAVANSITKPLVKLVDNLKQIKLDKKNEILEWKNQDEIGTLINEYNNMILKLEQSALLLGKSEREGAWREMAQQVAHEIKNPLTPMKLSVQYLDRIVDTESQEVLESTIKSISRTLIEQIDNLDSIASEFSNFAKMPAPIMETLDLNSLVSNVHDLFRKSEGVQVNFFEPIDEINVYADKRQLLRVLNNLVQNAIQAIPPHRKGKVDIVLGQTESFAFIKVIDNGVGIPEEMFGKVFYPNFTTKSSGTGLGLAMCKSIVESINGKIYFTSEIDHGTEFLVEIPLSIST